MPVRPFVLMQPMLVECLFGAQRDFMRHTLAGRDEADDHRNPAKPLPESIRHHHRQQQPAGVAGVPPPRQPVDLYRQEKGQRKQGKDESRSISGFAVQRRSRDDHRHNLALRDPFGLLNGLPNPFSFCVGEGRHLPTS